MGLSEEPALLIGELAAVVDVTPATIRHYERLGVLPPPARSPRGYRRYRASDVERLGFVRRAQRFGLSLAEIREVLSHQRDGEAPCGFVLDAVRRHAWEVDRRIAELQHLRGELAVLLARAEEPAAGTAGYCPLLEGSKEQ